MGYNILKRCPLKFVVGKKSMLCPLSTATSCQYMLHTRGDQKVRGKVLLNRIAFIDCNENSKT